MESRQPQKNQETEGRLESQPAKPRRFRIVKLEERIAPAKGGYTKHQLNCFNTSHTCGVTACNCSAWRTACC